MIAWPATLSTIETWVMPAFVWAAETSSKKLSFVRVSPDDSPTPSALGSALSLQATRDTLATRTMAETAVSCFSRSRMR